MGSPVGLPTKMGCPSSYSKIGAWNGHGCNQAIQNRLTKGNQTPRSSALRALKKRLGQCAKILALKLGGAFAKTPAFMGNQVVTYSDDYEAGGIAA
jgi:hypothetical protein